jgi:hypothetical protein
MKLDLMKAVYCYYFPEVRELLHQVERSLPDQLYFVTSSAEEVAQQLAPLFDPPLTIPAQEGLVDLDEIHVPIMDRIVAAYSKTIPALSSFEYRYPTSGSSEGLFHLLTRLKVQGVQAINVFEGEYEGYGAQARNLGMKVHTRSFDDPGDRGIWFISNPSACDGNLLPEGAIGRLCDEGHLVVLDLAYAGATAPHVFDVSHPNILAVVLSFSKPYGVFRFRIGGFTFSRDAMPTLYGNKWFKDTVRLCQALKLAEDIGPELLYRRYHSVQERVIREVEEEFQLGIRGSDALLIGHLPLNATRGLDEGKRALIAPYRRGSNYRFCLTPRFESIESAVGG